MFCRKAEAPREGYGATVYHGSRNPDLDELQGYLPSYKGSIGGGVYVDADYNVASFYGPYVYELELLLRPEEIFWLEPFSIPELNGSSVLVGEHVEPFFFYVDEDRYAVVEDEEDIPFDSARFFAALHKMLADPVEWGKWFDYVPYNKELAEAVWNVYKGATYSPPYFDEPQLNTDALPDAYFISFEVGDVLDDIVEQQEPPLDIDKVGDDLDRGMPEFVDKYLIRKDYGTPIDLDEIGEVVEEHGYKAVYLEGIRDMSELLVFDSDDLRMVGRADNK